MALELVWLILFLCLLITIIKYTLGAILKWSVPGAKARKDLGFQPTVQTRKLLNSYNAQNTHHPEKRQLSVADHFVNAWREGE